MTKEQKVQIIALTDIQPDIDQPRKEFDEARLSELASSIKTHGIMNPLVIEDKGNGKYMLVDGERRYRASKILKLKEVPAIVVPTQSEAQRLIQQFHLQEQHQGWSAVEKAMAVIKLSNELKITVKQLSQTLSLPEGTIADYISFSKLIDPNAYARANISLRWARGVVTLNNFVRLVWQRNEMEFTRDMQKKLEKAILTRVLEGEIQNPTALGRIKDSVRSDPKSILKFISSDSRTLEKLFVESKGRKAYFFRGIVNQCHALERNISWGLKLSSQDYFTEDEQEARAAVKRAYESIKKLMAAIG